MLGVVLMAWRLVETAEEKVKEAWYEVDLRVARFIRDAPGMKDRAKEVVREVAVEAAADVEDATLGSVRRAWGRLQGEWTRYAAVAAIRRIYNRPHKAAQDAYANRFGGLTPSSLTAFGRSGWSEYWKRIKTLRGSRLRYVVEGRYEKDVP